MKYIKYRKAEAMGEKKAYKARHDVGVVTRLSLFSKVNQGWHTNDGCKQEKEPGLCSCAHKIDCFARYYGKSLYM